MADILLDTEIFFNCYEIDDHLNEKLTDFIRLDYKHDLLTYKR